MTPDEKISELRAAHEVFTENLREAHLAYAGQLADLCPDSAEVLAEHHRSFCGKQEKLAQLELLLALRPDLPFAGMYSEFDAFLGANDEAAPAPAIPQLEVDADHWQRTAETKRLRTREAIISATVKLLLNGRSFNLRDVAAQARVGIGTVHNHFATKGALLTAAYNRLLDRQ
jgi:hypothetical protein